MKCKNCNKEFESKRGTARFCTPKCRVAFNRISVTDSVTKDRVSVTKDSVTRISVTELAGAELKDYTAQDLYDAIHSYPHDTWVDSPEYKELKHRLHTLSVSDLKRLGYHIPNWKRA